MAADYTYDSGTGIVTITVLGQITMAERNDCMTRLLRDPAIPDGVAVLIDVSRSASTPAANETSRLGLLIGSVVFKRVKRVAIVTAQVGHGILGPLVAENVPPGEVECEAFNSMQDARDWLVRRTSW